MKVLIVKLSSMGDLVQALPALSDAAQAVPGIEFDWVVDEAFAEIPQWHPAVRRVVISAHRRWRKQLLNSARGGDLRHFWCKLREKRYDLVIDAQSGLKSGLVTRMARGTRAGPDKHSVREYGAHWAYQRQYRVSRDQLAVERLRELFSVALGYPKPDTAPDFGLSEQTWPSVPDRPEASYLVFVTNASWDTKCWPEEHWVQLLQQATQNGYQVLLPWGSPDEQARAARLAEAADAGVNVLPRLSLSELAGILKDSAGAVCNDTGLAHIAASLDRPVVTVYGPTDPRLIGATGRHSEHLIAEGISCGSCHRNECHRSGGPEAECLRSIEPERVWQRLRQLQANAE